MIKKYLPYLLIVIVVFLAAGIFIDSNLKNGSEPILSLTNNKNSMGAELKNFGQAPEFSGIANWLNSDAVTMQNLRGKVVLIDFWTYSCINCIRTLPYVTKWYDTYKDEGFVVIGVHTPEFEFEKVTENVQTAIKRYGINYPVAQDNSFSTWNAYKNRFWPAEYLIDKNGQIVYRHFGEGNYDITENTIRGLLGLNEPADVTNPAQGNVRSPEIYFGLDRLEYLSLDQVANMGGGLEYKLPESLPLNRFALAGFWEFHADRIESLDKSKIRLHFFAGKVFMVASAKKSITLKIQVDGVNQPDVTVNESKLYPLFDSEDYKEHTIDIDIPESGLEAFTFTFG